MVKAIESGKGIALMFSEEEVRKLGLKLDAKYEVNKAKENLYVLTAVEPSMDEQIISLVHETPFKNRVEGVFEKTLDKDALKRFKEMVEEGKIIKFKLSEKYKKPIYKTLEEVKGKPIEKTESFPPKTSSVKEFEMPKLEAEEDMENYSLEKHGFIASKNGERIRQLSHDLRTEFEERELKGIKSFEGTYYLIKTQLYNSVKEKVLKELKEKKESKLENLIQKLQLNPELIKMTCEFLKEEGELIEKQKNLFKYVD